MLGVVNDVVSLVRLLSLRIQANEILFLFIICFFVIYYVIPVFSISFYF